MDWIHLYSVAPCEHSTEKYGSTKCFKFLTGWGLIGFLKRDMLSSLFCHYSVIYFPCLLDDCNYFSLFLREIRLITTFHLLFLSLFARTSFVFLSSSPISLAPCVTHNTPHLVPTLHVQYTLYECSHYAMYGTVSSMWHLLWMSSGKCNSVVGRTAFSSAMFLKLGFRKRESRGSERQHYLIV